MDDVSLAVLLGIVWNPSEQLARGEPLDPGPGWSRHLGPGFIRYSEAYLDANPYLRRQREEDGHE